MSFSPMMGFQETLFQMGGKAKVVFMQLDSQGEVFLVLLWMQSMWLMTLPRVGKRKTNRTEKLWLHATGGAYHTSNQDTHFHHNHFQILFFLSHQSKTLRDHHGHNLHNSRVPIPV